MSRLAQINRSKHSFGEQSLTTMITALVFSKLFYCSTVWSNTSQTNLSKFQALFRQAISYYYNKYIFFSKLFYCFTVWSNSSRTVTGSPKFRLSYCKRKRRFDRITPSLQQLRWQPVNELLYQRDAIMAFKCMTGRAPGYLSTQFRRCDVTVC